MSTRDKKLVELEMLLERPRNKRKIVFGRHLAKIEFDSKKSNQLIISGSAGGGVAIKSPIEIDLGSLGDGSYSHLIGIGYSNELVKAAATAIGWDDAATGDNNIIVSDGASLKIKEADDDILTNEQALSINADEKNLSIGAGSDLTLYHDGTHSYIENITGKLIISSSVNDCTKV